MRDFIIFIQARETSTRLPNKINLELGGIKVLDWVFLMCTNVGPTIILAPDGQVMNGGYETFHGSEDDVLDRFYEASIAYPAKNYVRITADCPLTCSDQIELMIKLHKLLRKEYTSNVFPHRLAIKGLDVEVFTREALHRAAQHAYESYDREHVTPWMQRNCTVAQIPNLSLDTKEDFELLKQIFN